MREMKDNGIAWTKTKVKYCCSMISGDGITSQVISDTKDADNIYPVYGGNGQRGYYSQYNRDGNYILIGRQGALAGNVHRTQGKIWAADHAIVVTCNNKTDIGFMYYLFIMMNLNRYAQDTAAQPGLAVSKIMSLSCIISNIETQKKIATYIERKYIEIEAIESELQHQIELLQEYKQSVITEAVTKGLDKNVAMKDSGIEWIGDIPHTWNVYRLKYIVKSSLQYGANESGLEYTDELPRYVRITDIDNNGRLKDTDKQSLDLHTAKPYLLDSNDILLARSGATVGKAFLYHESDGPCAFAGYLIRAKCKTELLSKLVYYYTMSYSYNDWKNSIFSQATIPNIGADKYSNLRIPISPNEKEQRKIIDYLDQKCAEIDAVLTDKQKQLDTLTEYKKSLIYEYVTGKKEVPADA